MKNSYWGKVDYSKKHCRGVIEVSTPRHGGIMVSKGFAKKNLSIAAQKRGVDWNGYLCYEEDCLAPIIYLELSFTKPESFALEDIITCISTWNCDYLYERGIKPNIEAEQVYLEAMQDKKLRAEKSPDLIVSAMSLDEKVVKVHTADNRTHFVTKESYHNNRLSGLNLLSKCVKVENYQQTTYLYY